MHIYSAHKNVLFTVLSQVILSLTLVLCVIITVVQLSGVEGNLLASAAVSCYAVFLAFSAVSSILLVVSYMYFIIVSYTFSLSNGVTTNVCSIDKNQQYVL
jgi:Serine incorporator (Serinc)